MLLVGVYEEEVECDDLETDLSGDSYFLYTRSWSISFDRSHVEFLAAIVVAIFDSWKIHQPHSASHSIHLSSP